MNYAFPTGGFGADSEFDAFIYGEKHPSTLNYLRNQFSRAADTLAEPVREFMQQSRDLFEHFNSSEAMRFARNAVSRVFQSTPAVVIDTVHSLFDLYQFQNAGLTMQRWVMANPVARKLYHDQQIDGYSDTYVDMHPEDIGENHYDYRRVNDGLVKLSEEHGWTITQYSDELKNGDRDLMIEEKSDILHSWSNLEYLLSLCKEDPTSASGGFM